MSPPKRAMIDRLADWIRLIILMLKRLDGAVYGD